MSFIKSDETSMVYAPGWFLAHEDCVRETREIPTSLATTLDDGSKYVPMGTPYPSDSSSAIGLVYEDVDVSLGNMPGSVVTQGVVYEERVNIKSATKSALVGLGFKFVTEPTVTRPDDEQSE